MNPRLKKLLLGIQVFTLACNKANANTKGLVYLQDGALVKPYLGLGDSQLLFFVVWVFQFASILRFCHLSSQIFVGRITNFEQG